MALAASALWATPAPAQSPSGTGGTVFRGGTDLVVLQVSAVDGQGQYVGGLLADDFAIYDEGVRQPIALFSTSSIPLDLMLLLDTSSSMYDRIGIARHAALEFVRTLRPDDRAALVVFSDRVRIAQGFTEDAGALEAAIQGASPIGGTALHEALYIALREFARTRRGDGRMRRQALVVLSDGDDTTSKNIDFAAVLEEARRGGVTVFSIMPARATEANPFQALNRHPTAEFNLRALAEETGGRAFLSARDDELAGTYMKIAAELGQQYWLAYMPAPPGGGGYRHVSVRVLARPDVRARTRSGYYAGHPRTTASVLR